ncbi:MAG TPA: hypothetical protein VJU34_05380 [Phenylobacterium sp.]|nr:hypothetical protein [Phenylobacterium sp.]
MFCVVCVFPRSQWERFAPGRGVRRSPGGAARRPGGRRIVEQGVQDVEHLVDEVLDGGVEERLVAGQGDEDLVDLGLADVREIVRLRFALEVGHDGRRGAIDMGADL